jgi:outer membrane biogenesis lipoprotein LolB
MKCSIYNRQFATILFIGTFFLSACSGLTARISERSKDLKALSEARELISVLKNQNLELKTFKSVGRITFWENEKKNLTTRIALVGSAPDRLRIVLQSVSGQPVASFASDGQWLYLFSHAQGKFYKKRATNSILKSFFSIPIKSDDIFDILAGRIPVNQHDSAVIIKDTTYRHLHTYSSQRHEGRPRLGETDAIEAGYVLVLKKGWGNVCEKIYLDAGKKDVHKVEVFDLTGALAYRAEFNRMQNVNGYKVPSSLVFSNDDGSGFQVDVDRYWADVSVSPSIFVLTPPK